MHSGTTRESINDTILLLASSDTSARECMGDASVSVTATILAFLPFINFVASIVILEYLG